MSKLNRILIAALVIQAVILVATRLMPSGGGDGSAKQQRAFPNLETKQVQRLAILDDLKKSVELERAGDKWVLASAGRYPAKKDKVEEVLGKLPLARSGAPVSTKKAHFRALEVDKDKFQRKVTLTYKDGKTQTFFLGSSPLIKKVHLRFADKNEVLLAGELSSWDYSTSASNWIETDYFKFEKNDAVALTLNNASGEIQLQKQEGKWALVGQQTERPLDQTQVTSLLSSVSSIALREPVGPKAEPAFKLASPVATLTVVTEKKPEPNKDDKKDPSTDAASQPAVQRSTHTIVVGAKKDSDYYAKASTSSFVVLLSSYDAETLTKKKVDDLLEKKKDDAKKGPALKGGAMPPTAPPPAPSPPWGQAVRPRSRHLSDRGRSRRRERRRCGPTTSSSIAAQTASDSSLTVVDEWTREGLAIEVAGSIRSTHVIDALARLITLVVPEERSKRHAWLPSRRSNG